MTDENRNAGSAPRHNASSKKLPGSMAEITAAVAPESWEKCRPEALKHLNARISIDGFRKGNVPENILIAKLGEMAVLEEMAELAVPLAYVEAATDLGLDPIGRPEIRITKLAKSNPLEFKAVTAVMPEVKLPDYRKLAGKVPQTAAEETAVSEKEVGDAVLRIRKMHASHEGHDHQKMTPEEHEKVIMKDLPTLDDEFVKKIGDFKDVADFKSKLRKMLEDDKKDSVREKRRLKIADSLADAAKAELPEIVVESELARTEAQFKHDVERMGVKIDDYLKHAKKSVEDLRKEWRPAAEKKARLQLILNEIARIEKLAPAKEEIDAEADHILKHYKDADRDRATTYAETVLTNEKVFRFLEEPR